MELAEDLGFCSCELRFLNHCRLFLNVISLSDIVNESGRGIDPTVTNFKKLPGKQLSDVYIQHKPDHTKWSIWFRFINLITNARQHNPQQLKQFRLMQHLAYSHMPVGYIHSTIRRRVCIRTYAYQPQNLE